jgi:hypothetical protein
MDIQYDGSQPNGNTSGINDRNFGARFSYADNGMVERAGSSATLSESKCEEICELLRDKFGELDHNYTADMCHVIGEERCQNVNVMSRSVMQKYIDNFWRNFHPQLPICK